jgi:hypothetical protein
MKMTALADGPRRRTGRVFVSRAAAYEWHAFIDGLAHSYLTAQLKSDCPPLLTPWCEEAQAYPLKHDRESTTPHRVRPIPGLICQDCLWDALPDAVRSAVQAHLGPVTVVRDIEQGQNCNVALVLRCDQGDVFLKGVRGVSPQMRWLRNESEAGNLAPDIAPATRFSEDVDADAPWLVVGFEYVNGRPADLGPGADDLATVATTVARISTLPGGSAQPLSKRWASADWWTKLAAEAPDKVVGFDLDELTDWCRATPDLIEGAALLHTDLHEHQFMINDDSTSARVIDWGRPASGAAWVDTAFLVVRLIAAGHEPEEAEEWAATMPPWSARTDKAVTAFACYVAGLWGYRAATAPFPGATRLGTAARQYARYRLTS